MKATAPCSICHIFPVVSSGKASGPAERRPAGICDRCFAELTRPSLAPASATAYPRLRNPHR